MDEQELNRQAIANHKRMIPEQGLWVYGRTPVHIRRMPDESVIWWRGALSSAVSGIPQGIMLGLIGFGLLVGSIYALSAIGAFSTASWMMSGLGGFLFQTAGAQTAGTIAASIAAEAAPAFSLAVLNPLPFVALNAILTIVGNFLTGGNQAVARAQQAKENEYLDVKMEKIEGREQQVEQMIAQHLAHEESPRPTPRHVQQILEEGPRVRVEQKHATHVADAVASRAEAAERIIH